MLPVSLGFLFGFSLQPPFGCIAQLCCQLTEPQREQRRQLQVPLLILVQRIGNFRGLPECDTHFDIGYVLTPLRG